MTRTALLLPLLAMVALASGCSQPTPTSVPDVPLVPEWPPKSDPALSSGAAAGALASPAAGGAAGAAAADANTGGAAGAEAAPSTGGLGVSEGAAGAPGAATPADAATASPAPTVTPVPPARPISEVAETLTHVDETIGYAIDYPAGWSIEASPGSLVMITSFGLDEPGRGGLAEGDTKIDIVPDLAQTTSTLEDLVAQTAGAGQVEVTEEWELAGGLPAVMVRLESPALGGKTSVLLTVVNGRGLRVQGFGDLSLFDSIARSLRPTS